VADGQYTRGLHRSRARTAQVRLRALLRLVPRRPAVIVAAAVAVATAAGGYVAENSATGAVRPEAHAALRIQADRLDSQLLAVREAAREDAIRASRERARVALIEQRRLEAEKRTKREAAERRKRAAEQRRRVTEERKRAEAERLRRLARAYVLPLTGYRLSAGFGQSGGRWSSTHTGQDFAAPSGTAVRAVAAGTVVSAEWAGAYGWRTIIRHADGTETWYCHLSSFVVSRGAVSAGQRIGRVGSTGNSTGPHLHLEVRVNGSPVDPLAWLRRHGVKA